MTRSEPQAASAPSQGLTLFAALFGGLLGLALLKLGNPVILDRQMPPPADWMEAFLVTWPSTWGYGPLVVVVAVGLWFVEWRISVPKWAVTLPLAWLGWQCLSATQTVDGELTRLTLPHFGGCVVCYFLGLLVLSRVNSMKYFWGMLLLAMGYVIWVGYEQHFGGLEQTRRYIWEQIYSGTMPMPSLEFLGKIKSDRIFSTLAYPNTLASVLILLLPVLLAALWQFSTAWPRSVRLGLVGALLAGGLATMYWSGSKTGWLIVVVLAGIASFRLNWPRAAKLAVVVVLVGGGFTGFLLKYRAYFERGATSAGARLDYWQAAWKTANAYPLLGTGPGTFQRPYANLKPPQAEMARLTHNDYLEQASDSGWPGFGLFMAWVWLSVIKLGRTFIATDDWIKFAAWLGMLGWAFQSSVEFGLYIPAVAWTAFALLGWLWGSDARLRPTHRHS